jgi:hypothetical protein
MPFKKIFKPIAKVLDKIIPNEIKPALPYLAAFAPVFGPPGLQSFIGESMKRRMLTSGLMNIGAQLSQEGSEGDINLLSAGIGALSGAMTAPGASDYFSMRAGLAGEGTGLMSQAQKFGFDTLAKGSDFLKTGGIDTAGGTTAKLLSTEGAKVATLPAATATGDVMQAQARQLEKQAAIDAALAEAETFADSGARAAAIRNAMNAYGFFTDEEIEETIASAGYKAGGRVGFEMGGLGRLMQGRRGEETEENFLTIDGGEGIKLFMLDDIDKPIIRKSYSKEDSGRRNEAFFEIINPETGAISTISQEDYFKQYGEPRAKGGRVGFRFGGIDAAIDKVEDESIKESMKFASDIGDMDIPIVDLVEEFEIIFKRKPSSLDELKQFYRDFYEYKGPGENIKMKEKIKETVTVEAKDGGLMDLGGKEMDLRGGGFVPIGKKERADDVPARLSKNEFVMTADAVRGAGGGDINKGAKRMYETMNSLEARA